MDQLADLGVAFGEEERGGPRSKEQSSQGFHGCPPRRRSLAAIIVQPSIDGTEARVDDNQSPGVRKPRQTHDAHFKRGSVRSPPPQERRPRQSHTGADADGGPCRQQTLSSDSTLAPLARPRHRAFRGPRRHRERPPRRVAPLAHRLRPAYRGLPLRRGQAHREPPPARRRRPAAAGSRPDCAGNSSERARTAAERPPSWRWTSGTPTSSNTSSAR